MHMKKSHIIPILLVIIVSAVAIFLITQSKETPSVTVTETSDQSFSPSPVGPFLVRQELGGMNDCVVDIDTALTSIDYPVSLDNEACPYTYALVDLNDDEEDEILVYLRDPAWCGSGGCTLLVVDAYNRVLGNVEIAPSLIYVGHELVNNWHPLFIAGGMQLDPETDTYTPTYIQFNFEEDATTSGYTVSGTLDTTVSNSILVDGYELLP